MKKKKQQHNALEPKLQLEVIRFPQDLFKKRKKHEK